MKLNNIKTNKKILKIKLNLSIRYDYLDSGKYYSMISYKQFLDYFSHQHLIILYLMII